MPKLNVGVIGVGHLGRFHALNYARLPGVTLVGLYDTNGERAASVAEETGTKAFYSMEDLLTNVDAVSIAVPTDHHFECTSLALNNSVHCLVEKPIARNLKEADEMIRLAEEKGLCLQVGHIERFNPAFRALQGFEFSPQFIETHRLAPFNPRGTEVSVVLDLMIHDLDLILHLAKSPVQSIDASGVAVVSDTVDIANVRLRFDNGLVANVTASRISQKKMRKMRLFQRDTYVTVDFLQKSAEVYRLEDSAAAADMVLGEIGTGDKKKQITYYQPQPPEEQGLEVELKAFLHSINGAESEAVTGKEARDALAVALTVLEQMEG